MAKTTLRLQPSEAVVISSAATIYASLVNQQGNTLESEIDLVERSVQTAIEIAQRVEKRVRSDEEMG